MSLRDQISQLVNPTPNFFDPEDEDDEITRAQVVDKVDDEFNEEDAIVGPSKLRSKKGVILADEDNKYAGRKVSRKGLDSESEGGEDSGNEEFSSGNDIPSDEASDEDAEESDKTPEDESDEDDLDSFNNKLKSAQTKFGQTNDELEDSGDDGYGFDDELDDDDDDDDGNDDDDDDEADDDEDIQDSDDMDEETMDVPMDGEDSNIQSFSSSAIEEEVEKGKAAKIQLGLWDSLLESRIKMQKSLIAVNQLPQPDEWEKFKVEGGEDYEHILQQGCSLLKNLGNALLELQERLLVQNPDTEFVVGEDHGDLNKDSEKEITNRKRKLEDFENVVSKRHQSFFDYRNDTIQKWNDKTQLSSGKMSSKSFSAFNQSALKQIDQILSDKERLVKRTQLVRSGQRILGKTGDVDSLSNTDMDEQTNLPSRDHLKTYDEEIFNDDDFYHQLLRELIEKKTTDINDPVALSRQWLEVQKMRSKIKKKVDTRASKGRKIRYDVHPKLVNFMAPVDSSTWMDESKNDLFSSLYGQRQHHK